MYVCVCGGGGTGVVKWGSGGTGTLWKVGPKFWLCGLAVGPAGSVVPVVASPLAIESFKLMFS